MYKEIASWQIVVYLKTNHVRFQKVQVILHVNIVILLDWFKLIIYLSVVFNKKKIIISFLERDITRDR